jgi:hypothetical protein
MLINAGLLMMSNRRNDVTTSAVVEFAIELKHSSGILQAWRHLLEHGLSTPTIQRVLALDGKQFAHRAR